MLQAIKILKGYKGSFLILQKPCSWDLQAQDRNSVTFKIHQAQGREELIPFYSLPYCLLNIYIFKFLLLPCYLISMPAFFSPFFLYFYRIREWFGLEGTFKTTEPNPCPGQRRHPLDQVAHPTGPWTLPGTEHQQLPGAPDFFVPRTCVMHHQIDQPQLSAFASNAAHAHSHWRDEGLSTQPACKLIFEDCFFPKQPSCSGKRCSGTCGLNFCSQQTTPGWWAPWVSGSSHAWEGKTSSRSCV